MSISKIITIVLATIVFYYAIGFFFNEVAKCDDDMVISKVRSMIQTDIMPPIERSLKKKGLTGTLRQQGAPKEISYENKKRSCSFPLTFHTKNKIGSDQVTLNLTAHVTLEKEGSRRTIIILQLNPPDNINAD